jgi:SAM-dependent methyltransferase
MVEVHYKISPSEPCALDIIRVNDGVGEYRGDLDCSVGEVDAVYRSWLGEESTPSYLASAAARARYGVRILDAACGTGRAIHGLADMLEACAEGVNNARCVGLYTHDVSGESLSSEVRQTFKDRHREYVAGTIIGLPSYEIAEDEFELVYTSLGLIRPDADIAVRQLMRVTRPGGQLLFWAPIWATHHIDTLLKARESRGWRAKKAVGHTVSLAALQWDGVLSMPSGFYHLKKPGSV